MKIKSITEEGIEFNNGTTIKHFHDQQCCENVYADWKQLGDTDAFQHEFNEDLIIEGVEKSGFRVEGYFVPCYNEQNGWYSSELELQITLKNGYSKVVDIDKFVEDKTY